MKTIAFTIAIICTLEIVSEVSAAEKYISGIERIILNADRTANVWTASGRNASNGNEISVGASVPGGIYSDLEDGGVLRSAVYREYNDLETRWVGRTNWTYSRTFTATSSILEKAEVVLVCEGLDTIAQVFINDLLVGKSENMFVRYIFDIKSTLRVGENTLRVSFQSPVEYAQAKFREHNETYGYQVLPVSLAPAFRGENQAQMIRKMQSSFSWDWGYNGAIIRDVMIFSTPSKPVPDETAATQWNVTARIYYDSVSDSEATLTFHRVDSMGLAKTTNLKKGMGQSVDISLTESGAKTLLWWPNGYGNQNLYWYNVSLASANSTEISTNMLRFGFRTVELVQDFVDKANKQKGREFYFKVNGVQMYSKGSNAIPLHVLPERITEAQTEWLLRAAKMSHQNILRTWGGGTYETEWFYDYADEYGIFIWEDFMFACAMYPATPEYLEIVRQEVDTQVKRLQYRTSLVMWAANNENEAALRHDWYGSGWNFELYKGDYIKLYIDTIKTLTEELDPSRKFISSSPTNGIKSEEEGWVAQDPYDLRYGDIHFYNYVSDNWDYNMFLRTRYASEYGYQSFPHYETLAEVADDITTWTWDSPMMDHRQHHPGGQKEIRDLIQMHFPFPENYDSTEAFPYMLYMAQLSQIMGQKTQTEFYRRLMDKMDENGTGHNMGALYWQLNDIWEGCSWASVEAKGRWKLQMYYALKFFAPILASPYRDANGDVVVELISDNALDRGFTGELNVKIVRLNSFTPVYEETVSVTAEFLKSKEVFRINKADLEGLDCASDPNLNSANPCVVYLTLPGTPDNFLFLQYPTNKQALVNPNLKITTVDMINENTFEFTVTSDAVAPFVFFTASEDHRGYFSDNGFVLTTNEKTIQYYSQDGITDVLQFMNQLKIMSLYDVTQIKETPATSQAPITTTSEDLTTTPAETTTTPVSTTAASADKTLLQTVTVLMCAFIMLIQGRLTLTRLISLHWDIFIVPLVPGPSGTSRFTHNAKKIKVENDLGIAEKTRSHIPVYSITKMYLAALAIITTLTFNPKLATANSGGVQRLSLDAKRHTNIWSVYGYNASTNTAIRISANVPGGIYSDLEETGTLKSPIYHEYNDLQSRWVGRVNWTFSRNFTVDSALLEKKSVILVCEGLDTVSKVYINDDLVGQSQNMFARYTFDIKHALKIGINKIRIEFQSPVEYAATMHRKHEEAYGYTVDPPAVVPAFRGENKVQMIRKMQSSFSWDWVSQVLTFFPLQVHPIQALAFGYNGCAIIRDVMIFNTPSKPVPDETSSTQWNVTARVYYDCDTEGESAILSFWRQHSSGTNRDVKLGKGEGVSKTHLWWPNGYGKQNLYSYEVSLTNDNGDSSSRQLRLGFRTVELVEDYVDPSVTSKGREFYFRVNGVNMYSKGSNSIPLHVLPERVTYSQTEWLLRSAKLSHQNMIRIWGGGVYESNWFYDLADEYGILIWQDFMFACALYPATDAFRDIVRQEVNTQVKRLQHRASLAMWAVYTKYMFSLHPGNNENEGALRGHCVHFKLIGLWGGASWNHQKGDYVKMYIDTIKVLVEKLDPSRRYIPSSPTNGIKTEEEGWVANNPGDLKYGDIHAYNYYGDNWDWSIFTRGRYSSEYGYQSFPHYETLAEVADDIKTWTFDSAMMEHRQRHPGGNYELSNMVRNHFPAPMNLNSVEAFPYMLYMVQLSQAMAQKTQTEFYRRLVDKLDESGTGHNMGALYWQLNDIWQGCSWAGVEINGRWKIFQYYAVNFFSPVLASPYRERNGDVVIELISDSQKTFSGLLRVQIFKLNRLMPSLFVFLTLPGAPDNFLFLQYPTNKQALLDPSLEISSVYQDSDGKTIRFMISTKAVAPFVFLTITDEHKGYFSDNGFILTTPQKEMTYYSEKGMSAQQFTESLKIMSLFDVTAVAGETVTGRKRHNMWD
ncbi:Beta-mannosidase [Orchesella cincta]|uniref:beta-mannosidase n=1 Tax=Orchesella cincta TaxID=48709 RepID=A0A1D2NB20_ORCCI|nr:Beta-mannosidase [Orchesella cincta]